MKTRSLLSLLLLLSLHLFLLTHLKFTAWPEMFSYPYLKNHSLLLYRDMIYPYPPVLTLILAYLYKIFGYKLAVLEWYSWIVILTSSVGVYLIAKQVAKNERAGLIATATYVFLQPFLDGNMMWFDIAIVPPVLLGTLFLLRKKLLWSGIFFALAAFIKQTAGLFYVFIFLWLVWHKTPIGKLRLFLAGPFIFIVPLLVRLWQENALVGFWNWVVWYPTTQWSRFPGYVQMDLGVTDEKILLLLLALLVLACWWGKKAMNRDTSLLFALGGLSLVMVYPRFSFFHFQLALAFWSALCGVLLPRARIRALVGTLLIFGVIMAHYVHYPVIRINWEKEARFLGTGDMQLAQNVAAVTKENETVFLQGVPSQIYILTNRLPPKPWFDPYIWYLEIPGVQEQILYGWGMNKPDVVIWKSPETGAWYKPGVYQPQKIVNFIAQNYTKDQELRPGVWVWRRK